MHSVVGLGVIAMVTAGFWQLHRLSERQDQNRAISDRGRLPVADVHDLVRIGDDFEIGGDLEYRPVRAVGVYQPAAQVLVRNRTYQGSAGYWVLTPMRLRTGALVAVNRGWIPHATGTGDSPATFAPPVGEVVVTGLVRDTVTATGLQQPDPADGTLSEMARPDLGRLARQLDGPLLPVYVQLEAQSPPVSTLPVPVPPPEQDNGPHLAYAVQWFVFATITLVGYPLILRRLGRPQPQALLSPEPQTADTL